MFGRRFFGAHFFGPRYFGDGGTNPASGSGGMFIILARRRGIR